MTDRQNKSTIFANWLIILVLVGISWTSLWAQDPAVEENEPRVLDEIVAKVNTEIITLTDLNKSLDVKERMLEVEGRFTNLIPTEDVRKVPEDLTAQIHDYLNRPDENDLEEHSIGETPLVLRAASE